MTAWAEKKRLAKLETDNARQEAQAVLCTEPGCGAQVGEPCRNVRDGYPLEEKTSRQVAHFRRIAGGQRHAAHLAATRAAVESGGTDAQQ